MKQRYRALKFIIVWMAVLILGWLAYALLRGLAAIIYLDVSFDDWQWYVPLIFLLVGLPAYILWSQWRHGQLRITRGAVVTCAVLILWLLFGYDGFGQEVQLSVATGAPIPISFWAYGDFRHTPDVILRDIEAAHGAIYLDAGTRPFEAAGRAGFVDAMHRLADYHIPVYWAAPAPNFLSVPVALQWVNNVRRAAELVTQEHLGTVRGFIGDVETPLNEPFDWLGSQRGEFDLAVNAYRELQAAVRRDYPDLRLGVTAMWAHFLDRLDGDADLSIAMRSPLDPPGGWHFVNLMTYSSYYPESWRPYYVYVLERAMARLYPAERVSHLLGLVGGGMPGEPVMSFEELVRDARISRALGVREIAVFQLDGALRVFGNDFVRRLNEAVNGEEAIGPVNIPFSRPVSIMFYGIAVADSLLDVLQSQTWLYAIWIGVSGWLVWRFTPPQSPTIPAARLRSENLEPSANHRGPLPMKRSNTPTSCAHLRPRQPPGSASRRSDAGRPSARAVAATSVSPPA